MVAQVDEQQPTMVADAVAPPGQPDGLANVALAQGAAGMGAVAVHRSNLELMRGNIGRRAERHMQALLCQGDALKHRSSLAALRRPSPACLLDPDKAARLRYLAQECSRS